MKRIFIFNIFILFNVAAFGQGPCINIKVITSIVQKPTNGSIISSTCSTLVVQWKGSSNQSYTADLSSYNATTKKWDTAYTTGNCKSSQTCTATFTVKAGSKVNWSVQAEQVINGRRFYSYHFIGERNHQIPACTQAVVTKAAPTGKGVPVMPVSVGQLLVYPNPATSEVTIQWSSDYKGAAVVTVSDAAGKEVRLLRIAKEGPVYTSRIPVGNLVAGLYYVQVRTQRGQALSEKFVKQ